jgi:hypothetical protein
MAGGGIRVDREVVADPDVELAPGTHDLQWGRRRFARVTVA